jgi:hypothetical protein
MNSKDWKWQTRQVSLMDASFIVGGLIRDLEVAETDLQLEKTLTTALKARIHSHPTGFGKSVGLTL